MNTKQQNQVTMYEAVLRFFNEAGTGLTTIKRIEQGRAALAAVLARIEATAQGQGVDTTVVSTERQALKADAVTRAEILRLLVVTLSPDAVLRGDLKVTLSRKAAGREAELLKYLQRIDEAVDTIEPEVLAEAGYDPAVRAGLQQALKKLKATQGVARQLEAGVSVATDALLDLIKEATLVLEEQIDPLVSAQRLAKPELVNQYETVRKVVNRAARHGKTYKGVVRYGQPALVYDRREAGILAPALTNRSRRGLSLRFYTAASPTTPPLPKQGVLVKSGSEVSLPDYVQLGDEAYLLVVVEQMDGEGKWAVR